MDPFGWVKRLLPASKTITPVLHYSNNSGFNSTHLALFRVVANKAGPAFFTK